MWLLDKFCLLFRQLEYPVSAESDGVLRSVTLLSRLEFFFSVLVHFSCAEGEVPFQTWACPGCQVWSTPCFFTVSSVAESISSCIL